ncbi:MAG: hypothetical protein ACN4G0_03610 [Polyangiales bacterium]
MPSKARLQPVEALRLAAQALGGRISIPLSLVRSRIEGLSEGVAIEIEAAEPGLRVRGEARALGAPIAFAARIEAEGVGVDGEQRTVRVQLSEVSLTTTEDAPGPLAEAIRTGMIDTENPATLIGNMIAVPEMLVSAEGKDVVLDLMKAPVLRDDEVMRAAVAAASSYLSVTDIQISGDAIELQLGFLPGGVKEAALSTARAVLMPAVRFLWPEGTRR